MGEQKVCLKQNVLALPLINRWYAWPNLIAPATAAMFIANSHLKIMQSFAATPQLHVSALKNPAMRGGPFINYDASRAGEIKALLDKTTKEQAEMLRLAAGIKSLIETLDQEADGASLVPLYSSVPDILRGYVELVYDLNNNPSIRFIEGLLYRRYYNTGSQSVSLSLVEKDERPFLLSTPNLGDPGSVTLSIPFSSEALDELFRMKYQPQALGYIREALQVSETEHAQFAEFFTEVPPPAATRYEGDGVRIRYFGHACILIESKEVSILMDPVISYNYGIGNGIPRYTFADLPPYIDYVLITHNHQDHCIFETLLQLRHKVGSVVVPRNNGGGLADPSLKLVLQNIGFKQVCEIDELEALTLDGGTITGLPFLGEHGDLNIGTKIAYLVNLKGRSVLCAADSNNIEPKLYENIHSIFGDVDVIFLGMECDGAPLSWLYGPFLTKPLARNQDQSRRLDGSNYEKAIDLVDRLNPKRVFVYAMGHEPWLTYLSSIQYTEESRPIVDSNKLVADCRSRGLESERLFGHKEIHL